MGKAVPLGESQVLDTDLVTPLMQVAMQSVRRKQARTAELGSAFLVGIFNCGISES